MMLDLFSIVIWIALLFTFSESDQSQGTVTASITSSSKKRSDHGGWPEYARNGSAVDRRLERSDKSDIRRVRRGHFHRAPALRRALQGGDGGDSCGSTFASSCAIESLGASTPLPDPALPFIPLSLTEKYYFHFQVRLKVSCLFQYLISLTYIIANMHLCAPRRCRCLLTRTWFS